MKNVLVLLVGFILGFLVTEFFNPFENEKTVEEFKKTDPVKKDIEHSSEVKNPSKTITPNVVEVADPNGPVLSFNEEKFDFGDINQGEKVTHIFKFTNEGKSPLIISNAKAGCGCTVPQWPKEPIAPGQSSEIEVAYDSKGKKGKQTKTITITSNSVPNTKILTISTNILVPEQQSN